MKLIASLLVIKSDTIIKKEFRKNIKENHSASHFLRQTTLLKKTI